MAPVEQLRSLYESLGLKIRFEGNPIASRFVGVCVLHVVHVGRVALGSCPPRARSDPDVRNYRIRLLEQRLRYELRWRIATSGSGYRLSRRLKRSHVIPRCDRRESHFPHACSTWNRNWLRARAFPVIP